MGRSTQLVSLFKLVRRFLVIIKSGCGSQTANGERSGLPGKQRLMERNALRRSRKVSSKKGKEKGRQEKGTAAPQVGARALSYRPSLSKS